MKDWLSSSTDMRCITPSSIVSSASAPPPVAERASECARALATDSCHDSEEKADRAPSSKSAVESRARGVSGGGGRGERAAGSGREGRETQGRDRKDRRWGCGAVRGGSIARRRSARARHSESLRARQGPYPPAPLSLSLARARTARVRGFSVRSLRGPPHPLPPRRPPSCRRGTAAPPPRPPGPSPSPRPSPRSCSGRPPRVGSGGHAGRREEGQAHNVGRGDGEESVWQRGRRRAGERKWQLRTTKSRRPAT